MNPNLLRIPGLRLVGLWRDFVFELDARCLALEVLFPRRFVCDPEQPARRSDLCVEVFGLERVWILVQMRLKFIEPRLLLLLKLGVLPVVQLLRPLKERPLRFDGIRCASDVERIPGPWPFFWAPTRWVVPYSACQLVESKVLPSSRSCGDLLELEVGGEISCQSYLGRSFKKERS